MRKLFSFIILFSHTFIRNLFVLPLDSLEINENEFEIWSIGSKNISIPHEVDYFSWRQLIEIPFHSRRYIAQIKAVIKTENAKNIENISLYRCSQLKLLNDSNDRDEWVAEKIIIDDKNEEQICYKLLAFWSQVDEFNKTLLSLPKSIGIPIGDNQCEKYLLLEINYENSNLISDLIDSSGFKLYIDKENREIDADIVAVGSVPDYRFFIPPKVEEWTVTGNCYKDCLRNKLNTDEINILTLLYYGKHELLQDFSLEIIKSDGDSKTLFTSSNQKDGIDNQQKLELGINDRITTSCRFNSINQNKTILGGFSRDSAQCIAWLLYYPKVDGFDACLSSFSLSTIMSITGIEQLEEKWRTKNDVDILIKNTNTDQIERFEDYLIKKSDWDYKRINRSKYVTKFGKQTAQCNWQRSIFDEII